MGEEPHRWSPLKRILVLVEGQTEERFIKDVMYPYLISFNVAIIPTIVETKKLVGAPSHKGGGDFSKFKADVLDLLGDTHASAVTTLYDFYGFPKIPNVIETVYKDIQQLEAAIANVINNQRFKPYLQRHEFEAFMFIEPELTAKSALQRSKAVAIEKHRNNFNCVEDINLDPKLAPSKRLESEIGKYNKPRLGAAITNELGIERLIKECPKFSLWVEWLKSHASNE